MPRDLDPPVPPFDIEPLIRPAVREMLAHEDPRRFLAWFRDAVTAAAAGTPLAGDTAACRALATRHGMALWNAMPLPGNGFRPAPLPVVGRNDRCPCGSGDKFKQCCGGGAPVERLSPDDLWDCVIEELPPERLALALARRELPAMALAFHADALLVERGDAEAAARLLEPLFAAGAATGPGDGLAIALDVLLAAYRDLGRRADGRALAETVAQAARSASLRSMALRRLAEDSMEDGDADAAWRAFAMAQRATPREPAIAELEMVLLGAEERFAEMPSRARAWVRRLERDESVGDEFLDWLDRVAEDPRGALADLDGEEGVHLRHALEAMDGRPLPDGWSALPVRDTAPGAGDGADAGDAPADAVVLVPPPAVAALEARWHAVFGAGKPLGTHDAPPDGVDAWENEPEWAALLAAEPAAFDSVDILDDLVTLLDSHPRAGDADVEDGLYRPLLARAVAIVEHALGGWPHARLPWLPAGNRAALRSMVRLAFVLLDDEDAGPGVALCERVMALNPDDQHGLRALVAREYLHGGRDEAMVALAAAYPDDLTAEVVYGNALSLYRLGRREAADAALFVAIARLPTVAAYLVRERVRKPPLGEDGEVTIGGDDQAWYHWQAMRGTWAATPGAIAWVRQSLDGRRH